MIFGTGFPVSDVAVSHRTRGRAGVWTAGRVPQLVRRHDRTQLDPWPGSVRAYQRRLARFEIGDYDTELPRRLPEREPALV